MSINLDDYFISIESLNNFDDNSIENWINSSKKPKKIEKKLKKISENGGKFTANQFDVIATDCVKIPFLLKNDEKWNIQFGEARMVHFFPSFEINLDETIDNEEKSRVSIDLNKTTESLNNSKLLNKNQSITEDNNLNSKKTKNIDNNDKNRLSIDLSKNSESIINLSNNNEKIIEEKNHLEVKKATKKRKCEENVLITEIKKEKNANDVINTAEVKLEEISPPKKKKKRKTDNIEDLSIDNVNLIDGEIIEKKKKKKSKVSFLADDSLLNNKDETNNNIAFNISSKLNESQLNSSKEIEAVSDVEKSHKKKKKHSKIQEEVSEVVKTEKKVKKSKKEKSGTE